MTSLKNNRGFTLIELLVVVAVLALLASIVFSNLGGAREGARISNALSFESQTHSLLGSDLVGWWKLDDSLSDTSGYGNNGTWSGAGSPTYVDGVPGKGGKAIEFDGVGDYVEIGNPGINNADFTILAWAFSYPEGTRSILGLSDSSSDGNYIILNQNTASIRNNESPSRITITASAESGVVNDEEWYHIGAIWNEAEKQLKLYINGTLEGQGSDSNFSSIDNVINETRIGSYVDNAGSDVHYWPGLIDDVRIYSRALTSEEIDKIHAENKDKYLADK